MSTVFCCGMFAGVFFGWMCHSVGEVDERRSTVNRHCLWLPLTTCLVEVVSDGQY